LVRVERDEVVWVRNATNLVDCERLEWAKGAKSAIWILTDLGEFIVGVIPEESI